MISANVMSQIIPQGSQRSPLPVYRPRQFYSSLGLLIEQSNNDPFHLLPQSKVKTETRSEATTVGGRGRRRRTIYTRHVSSINIKIYQ